MITLFAIFKVLVIGALSSKSPVKRQGKSLEKLNVYFLDTAFRYLGKLLNRRYTLK